MREEIRLSPDGFFACASFIGQLWSMKNLGISANPASYIIADAHCQRRIDSEHYALAVQSHFGRMFNNLPR